MKILEAQSATLTNYEVYQHLKSIEDKSGIIQGLDKNGEKIPDVPKMRPGNLKTIKKELITYFEEAPSPLGTDSCSFSEKSFPTLLQRLRPYHFTKAEILMIINLRPTKPSSLNTIVEEMANRYPTDEQQWEIVDIITQVLGKPDLEAEAQAMTDNATKGREENVEEKEVVEVEES